jgi:hypothetical protein
VVVEAAVEVVMVLEAVVVAVVVTKSTASISFEI